jgi:glucose-6-phosphate isomerase
MIKFDFNELQPKKDEIEVFNDADFIFTKIQPDMDRILETAGKYGNIKNLIIVARGGSISTFRAFWHGFGKYISDKKVYFVDTVDPDYTFYVKDKCTPDDSLVVAISKSGTTVDVVENVLVFDGFTQVVITTEGDNPLGAIAKEKGYDTLSHQDVGGRFSGLTEVSLFPSVICGLDISGIRKGATQAYSDYEKGLNDAKKLALIVKDLADKDYNEIFWPIYSKKLVAFSELIAQLINESVAKDGKGISTIIAEGPECHHYLTQRFFGGPKNMIGLFTAVTNFDEEETVNVPENLKNTKLRDGNVGHLDGMKLSDSMKFELKGTYEDAKNSKIPSIKLEIDKVDEFNLGYFTAFLHVFTIYLARAFEVNPFDQPEVEGSKKISFEARKNYKK